MGREMITGKKIKGWRINVCRNRHAYHTKCQFPSFGKKGGVVGTGEMALKTNDCTLLPVARLING